MWQQKGRKTRSLGNKWHAGVGHFRVATTKGCSGSDSAGRQRACVSRRHSCSGLMRLMCGCLMAASIVSGLAFLALLLQPGLDGRLVVAALQLGLLLVLVVGVPASGNVIRVRVAQAGG